MSTETEEKTVETEPSEATETTATSWRAPKLPSWVPSTWNEQAQRGVERLESLWKEAQKAQESGVERARVAFATASEKLESAASDLKSRGSILAQRAQEKFGSREAEPETAEKVTPPSPPESEAQNAPEA